MGTDGGGGERLFLLLSEEEVLEIFADECLWAHGLPPLEPGEMADVTLLRCRPEDGGPTQTRVEVRLPSRAGG
jgi:hypothetical protein